MFEQLTQIFTQTHPNYFVTSISPKEREDFMSMSHRISEAPWLPGSEIHKLCLDQEKKVMNQILSTTPIDLYEEITNACPDLADLKKMPLDQVKTKIIQFTQNIQKEQPELEQQYELQSVSIAEQEQVDIGSLKEIVQEEFAEMQLIEEYIPSRKTGFEEGIDNMFAQEPHTGLPWTDFVFYEAQMSD